MRFLLKHSNQYHHLLKANYVLLMIKGRNLQMHWIKLIFEKFLNINNFLCENRHSWSLKRQFTSTRNQKVHWNNNKKFCKSSSFVFNIIITSRWWWLPQHLIKIITFLMEDNKYISYRRQKYISGKECLYWTTNIQRATCLRNKED